MQITIFIQPKKYAVVIAGSLPTPLRIIKQGRIIMTYAIIFLIMAILLSACAWTKLTSFTDPDYANINFSKVLIVAPFHDLEYRETTEKAFQDALYLKGITAIKSTEILPPTREYSQDEILNLLNKYNIDGILFIAFEDYWTSQTYVPKYSSTKGSASLIGNSIYYSENTQNYGGYYISKPRITFELRLYDANTGRTAWIAKSNTRGNAFADFKVMINSLASGATNKLKNDGLIIKGTYKKAERGIKNLEENSLLETKETKSIKTRLPKLRAAVPDFNKYTDDEIISAYRQKYPKYKNATDEEIITILEERYGKK